MAKVVIAGRIHPAGMALLEAEPGLEIDLILDPGAALPMARLADAEALLIRYGVLSATQAAAMPKLRVVSRHGVGCDNLPVQELAALGVPVTIVGAVNAVSVAEQVLAMLLALTKQIGAYDAAVRSGNWAIRDSLAVVELSGRKLLLLGFGRIGREVARRATAFDMEVLVHDPYITDAEIHAAGCTPTADWRAVLPRLTHLACISGRPRNARADRQRRACPNETDGPDYQCRTRRSGGRSCSACRAQRADGGGRCRARLFRRRAPSPDLPLLRLPNVVLSPHSAALSQEAAQRMGEVAARNVIAGLKGCLDPALIFNRKALKEAGHAA